MISEAYSNLYNMKKTALLLTLLAFLPILSACNEEKSENLPAISGKAGEIIVVASKSQWEAEAGSAIRDALASEYLILPQKEPKFNLSNVPESSVNKLLKVHRNMLYLDIKDGNECAIKVRKDVWAHPQTMVIVSAPDVSGAATFIADNAGLLVDAFEKAERERVIANAKAFEEIGLGKLVGDKFGGSPCFPKDYSLKKQTPDFLWISNETSYVNQGIFIYSFPYTDESQLTAEALIAKRNEVMKENVPATMEDSYMITNPTVEPISSKVVFNGIQRIEIRSLWDTQNDFMGGPFVQHAMVSKDKSQIIVIEGFVYAPKYNKRNYLRQVEALISSFRWKE